MHKIITALAALLLAIPGKAQLWQEWFRQKETALRYSGEQVAAWRTYAMTLRKGYTLVQQGLQTIDALKKGDFLQHLAHISGLSAVNPVIKSGESYTAFVQLLAQTDQLSRQYLLWLKKEPHLEGAEKQYGQQVYQQLTRRNKALSAQLSVLVSDGGVAMDDAARLQRIDGLYQQAIDLYQFARHFAEGSRQLAGQRRQAQKVDKVLYQIRLD